jgi:hypothetical protein
MDRRANANLDLIAAEIAPEAKVMPKRRPNYRLAKIHRSYSVDEVSKLLDVHRNTVREWVKRGLRTCDDKRPMLILGRDLAEFLLARRVKNKQPCLPGQIYCVRCRAPKYPAGDMAEYQQNALGFGNLVGICPSCESMIYRRINLSRLALIRGKLDVTAPQAP